MWARREASDVTNHSQNYYTLLKILTNEKHHIPLIKILNGKEKVYDIRPKMMVWRHDSNYDGIHHNDSWHNGT